MKKFALRTTLSLLAVGALGASWAVRASDDTLPDPTRLPGLLAAPVASKDGAADTGASTATVQVIKYGPTHQSVVINGQEIPLGGRYGDAKVTAITPTEVVLRTGKEKQVLKLFPDAEKKTAASAQIKVQRK
jgi:MSHA biogenesis protein MshK